MPQLKLTMARRPDHDRQQAVICDEMLMLDNAVGWFEIYVDDLDRAKRFYAAVLGVTFERLPNPDVELWAFPMNRGGSGISGALVHMPGFAAGGNSTLVYFSCQDCGEEAGRVEAAGGRIEKSKFSIGQYGHIALAIDTEGNMFGLHSMG